MRNSRLRLPLIISLVLILGLVAGGGAALAQSGDDYRPPHDRPGPAVDTLHYRSFNVDLAPQELQRDEMDMYIFNLKTDAAQALRGDDSVELYEAPASTISLILNPAPAPEGQLNPFSLPEVRRAVQHLVNREFITQEIYKGLARPMHTHVNPFDFDYTVVSEMLARQDLSYDPERARAAIADAMTAAGATMVDGAWNYNDEPIRLRFIIRVEDERREVGDLIRAELEQAGFLIAPIYHQFAPAILTVYSTDPQLFEWHAYTEGWGRGAAERYDSATINQMAAPWLGNMPGWQETGFWQYENARLDDLGQRIFRGDFNDRAERDALYQEATRVSVDESVRVWLATILTTFPANSEIVGVTQDVAAGPKLQWTFREAYIPNEDTLTVGHLWVWTERSTWNPVSGFGDVYSSDVWRNLADPAMTRHPFTGLPIPMRADYEVETAGPGAKMSVPASVQRWDAEAGEWASVGDGVEATSKVTFDYSKFFQAPWHHGEQITMADLVYDIYQTFDMVYGPEKSQVEFALATTAKPLLDTVRGFRVLDENRIEVYVDYWHFVDDYIAEYAVPGGMTMPWEVLAAMDDVVFNQRRAAYSDTSAQRFGVPWLSLVQDRDARTVDRTLGQFERDGFVPMAALTIGGQALVTEQEATERYQAAQAWFDERSLMVISNGPFYLERFDPPAQFAELKAFRDENYPFSPGDWHFGAAEPISLEPESVSGIVIGQPLDVSVDVDGPGELGVRYVWSDPATGNVVKSGDATADGGGFVVPFSAGETAALVPGLYRLSITAYSDQLSTVSERVLTVEASATGTTTGGNGTTTTPTDEDDGGDSGGCGLGAPSADLLLIGGLLAGLVGVRRRKLI